MASTIALIGLVVFMAFMIIFHKMHKWCAPRSSGATTTEARVGHASDVASGGSPMRIATPMTPASSCGHRDDCGTPAGVYAIDMTGDATSATTAVRETRVISFIRFSGYTDSDASISERSTSLSFWTAFYNTKDSECSAASPVASPIEPDEATPAPQRPRPYIPRLDSPVDEDAVEIEALDGFAQRNMLAFKPQKPRALTTKHFKKHTFSRPAAVFLV